MRTEGVTRLMVAGGGWHNPVIREGLMAALPQVEFIPAESLGLSVDLKEALAFALIGWASLHGLPGDVPGATGAASARILGTITPGRGPLVLPNPVTAAPTSLTIERA
jgi:anhydro-N-acetylmuramic acid kinase